MFLDYNSYIKCKRNAMGMAKKVAEDIADMLLNEHVNIKVMLMTVI